ncbi:MAG: hypothetical protein GF411_02170 [Candidatus Lokiarchaeota archaeon]|nr:hypothetical protein [Candidatus Lokiarchaeota archaeon]
MFEIQVVGPTITILALVNVFVHLYEDLKMLRHKDAAVFTEPSARVPSGPMAATIISTLLAFGIILVIMLEYLLNLNSTLFALFILLGDSPVFIWPVGFGLVILGIILHVWSRYVRQDMAASWAMSRKHILVTRGPYSRIRHPSYSAYMMCFIGLFLLIPSVLTLILLLGLYGYREIAIIEESMLLDHFGEQYGYYMTRTGRFLPF